MLIETVEASAWRHLDVAREAIDLERTRRLQALAPGESVSFIDSPPPPPASLRQAQSAGTSATEVQAQPQTQTASAPQIASARQVADALQAHMHALLALNLHPFGGVGGGANALLGSFEAATTAAADAASNGAAMTAPTASTDQRLATEFTVTEDNASEANSDGLIPETAANHQEDGSRIDEGSFYGSESRRWEAAWDARMSSYDAQYNALSTFRGSVSQGYLDYANEMSMAYLQQPSWDDFIEDMGLEAKSALGDPWTDDASAPDSFDLSFDRLIDQAARISENSTTTPGVDATETPDASAQVSITEREQQGIDQSDDIQYQRLEEQAEANGTSGRLPEGRFQTADGRMVTPGGHAVTHPAQWSGSSSAYPDQYVHVGALPGVWPKGELTPAPDLPALPAELTPTLLDGRTGTGVPYRDQAGQIFYETFDADGKAVGLRSVSAAATPLPLADLASTAAPLVLTGLTAEASYGPWPFRVAAVATLAGATWLMARGTDSLLDREALDPERVRDDQLPPVNVPVSPGPGGTPGYVTDSRDTSTPALQPPDLLPPLTTTLPTTERSWRDLIVEAGGSWNTSNESTDANVVQQSTSTSCGPACAQMLLGDRGIAIDQSVIGDSLTSAQGLAASLNSVDSGWIGAGVDPSSLAALTRTGSWSAMMWEPGARAGHWVVVDGISPDGLVNIRDPFDATRYEVTQSEFLNHWSGYSVFKP